MLVMGPSECPARSWGQTLKWVIATDGKIDAGS